MGRQRQTPTFLATILSAVVEAVMELPPSFPFALAVGTAHGHVHVADTAVEIAVGGASLVSVPASR